MLTRRNGSWRRPESAPKSRSFTAERRPAEIEFFRGREETRSSGSGFSFCFPVPGRRPRPATRGYTIHSAVSTAPGVMVIPRQLSRRWAFFSTLLISAALAGGSLPLRAQGMHDTAAGSGPSNELPPILKNVRYEQKLDSQVPLKLAFRDEAGREVRLGEYFGKKPVVLILAYYRCPMLCSQVLAGATHAFTQLRFRIGQQFNVLTVSFDPRETPALAASTKDTYLHRYGHPEAADGWHFLTGQQPEIAALTQAVGFHYA